MYKCCTYIPESLDLANKSGKFFAIFVVVEVANKQNYTLSYEKSSSNSNKQMTTTKKKPALVKSQ